MDAIETKRKALTKDEIIQQLMDMLKENQMHEQSNNVFEICAYVDGLEKKLDIMSEELVSMRKQIDEMKEDTVLNNLKKSVSEAADRLQNRCNIIKEEIGVVKTNIRQTAVSIVKEAKIKGRAALNRVSEFFGVKDRLVKMKDTISEGIIDTDKTIAKIEAFGAGMREANQQIANTFRTFADKPEVDYSQKEQKFSKTEFAVKPWKWQRKVYESMIMHLDGAISKCQDLSNKVEIDRMSKKFDVVMAQAHAEQEVSNVIPMVAEEEKQYGAEVFESSEVAKQTEGPMVSTDKPKEKGR